MHRLDGLGLLREAAQRRERPRLPPLAREVEDEEERVRGLLRPVRAVGEPLQHPEQPGRGLVPVVERPAHGVSGQVVTRAREGADGVLDVHGLSPSSPEQVRQQSRARQVSPSWAAFQAQGRSSVIRLAGWSGRRGEDVGEPSLRVDIVQFGGGDQRVHEGSPGSAAIRTSEEP